MSAAPAPPERAACRVAAHQKRDAFSFRAEAIARGARSQWGADGGDGCVDVDDLRELLEDR